MSQEQMDYDEARQLKLDADSVYKEISIAKRMVRHWKEKLGTLKRGHLGIDVYPSQVSDAQRKIEHWEGEVELRQASLAKLHKEARERA